MGGDIMKILKDPLSKSIQRFNNNLPDINELLRFCTEHECSDLYIKVGQEPYISRYGKMYRVPCFPVNNQIWNSWAKIAITSENNSKYVRQKMLDFSYEIEVDENKYRYRVSAGFSCGKNIATFRMISVQPPTFERIDFPDNVHNKLKEIISKRNKITMFVGPTGSGKTTTMVACINDFTREGGPLDDTTIISLEDPIEYLIETSPSVNVIQKELGTDFKEFSLGIKQALREHPNVINVGETRDKETIKTLIEASRTGHQVITSFHATDVGDAISRIYNYICSENQDIMYDLITNMHMIICQRLYPSDDGFNMDIQYLVFDDVIIRYLNKNIMEGKNIPTVIADLFNKKELENVGLLKDWSVK